MSHELSPGAQAAFEIAIQPATRLDATRKAADAATKFDLHLPGEPSPSLAKPKRFLGNWPRFFSTSSRLFRLSRNSMTRTRRNLEADYAPARVSSQR